MDRIAMESCPSESVITTGRLTTAPVPRMPTCGWLMIGVSVRAPREPMLVMVNVRLDLVGAGALGQVGDAPGQAGQVQVAGVVQHRDDQALVGVHRDADVLGVVVGNRLPLGIDGCVELW